MDKFVFHARSARAPFQRAGVAFAEARVWQTVELEVSDEGRGRFLHLLQEPVISIRLSVDGGKTFTYEPSAQDISAFGHLSAIADLFDSFKDTAAADVPTATSDADKSDPAFQAGYAAGLSDRQSSDFELIEELRSDLATSEAKVTDLTAALDAALTKITELEGQASQNAGQAALGVSEGEVPPKGTESAAEGDGPETPSEETSEAEPAPATKPRKGK